MATRNSPCMGCTERFIACSDHCPKDARGEYGYKAWKADYHKIIEAQKEYKRKQREDFLMSEQCESAKVTYCRQRGRKNFWRD